MSKPWFHKSRKLKLNFLPILVTTIVLVCSAHISLAQEDEVIMKAAFIERFTRFIEWPEDALVSDSEEPFKILILGENDFGKSIATLFTTVQFKEKDVHVIYSDDYNSIKDCNLVYLSADFKNRLDEISELCKKYSVLSVSDTEGFAEQGVLINFYISENILKFEINTKELRKSKLKVSNMLLSVSKKID